jgi:hypothetical protein
MKSFQRWALPSALMPIAIVIAACSSESTTGVGSGGKGSSSSGTVPSGSGLTGTWDLVSSGGGKSQGTGTLALSADTLDLTLGSALLVYKINGTSATLTFQQRAGAETETLSVARTNAAFDTGALPLPLGGTWSVTQSTTPGAGCTGTIGTDSQAQCTHADLPDPFPNPVSGVIYTGKRTATGTSVFGDLGGEWRFASTEGTDGCTAKFNGSQVALNCDSNIGHLAGGVTLTFTADFKSVSGTTTQGAEVSGHKR